MRALVSSKTLSYHVFALEVWKISRWP